MKPKLPSRKDLRPYPNSCYLEYKGHTGGVTSISTDSSGQWIASGISIVFLFNVNELSFFLNSQDANCVLFFFFKGSTDGSVRIWEVETGRCLKVWQFDEAIKCVAWNPLSSLPVLAIAM